MSSRPEEPVEKVPDSRSDDYLALGAEAESKTHDVDEPTTLLGNATALISGRSIQGAGAGGIYVLIDIVCCDLIPLRDRGKYLGVINAWAAVGAAIGPVLGGSFARSNWWWIFYLNIPVRAVPLATLLIFMRMKTGAADPRQHLSKVSRIDYLGSIIFIPNLIALIFGLVAGGVEFPWSSWRIILPLVIGMVGWVGFHIYEHFITFPSVPTRLFSYQTSAAAYLLAFLSSVLATALSYFMPIYFQGVLGSTVFHSGVYFLLTAIGTFLFAVIAGVLLSQFGAYRPLHAGAFPGLSMSTALPNCGARVSSREYLLEVSPLLALDRKDI
ncbi:major facilitator superfamily domain-containing protein [Ustulina deusta]|nr:major facilitator superfamily domain-containing protein [Ustulina deusta]